MKVEEKYNSITMLRTVNLKVVVTEDFKKYAVFQLEERFKMLKSQLDQVDNTLAGIIQALENENQKVRIPEFKEGALKEKNRITLEMKSVEDQIGFMNSLVINSLFNQGVLQSMVNVSIGDDLYLKLSGMEIIVKDGIVQEIKPVT
ncbi:MAG: YlqD family protein [Candidatus Margulisiibacteriota bacterium]